MQNSICTFAAEVNCTELHLCLSLLFRTRPAKLFLIFMHDNTFSRQNAVLELSQLETHNVY
jgi:hypothetical protein